MVTVCRPWVTTKSGKRIFASQYGKKAFCFLVEEEKPKVDPKKDETAGPKA